MTYNYKTTARTILGDLYTPVGVYMRLRDLYPQSALMESSDYHDAGNSSSFIGINPIGNIAIGHGKATLTFPDGTTSTHDITADYRCDTAINQFIHSFHITGEAAHYCGLYGYTTFNAVRYFEHIAVKDTTMQENDAPDILYIMYKDIIVFDHFNNKMTLVTLTEEGADPATADGNAELDRMQMLNTSDNTTCWYRAD